MTDFKRTRGDTYPDVFQVINTTTGAAVDLTGVTSIRMSINPSKAPVDATATISTRTGTVTDAATGWVSIPMSPTDADFVGKFFQDIEIVDAQGFKRTIDIGKYVFAQDVTK